jgi:hypothetical protein
MSIEEVIQNQLNNEGERSLVLKNILEPDW